MLEETQRLELIAALVSAYPQLADFDLMLRTRVNQMRERLSAVAAMPDVHYGNGEHFVDSAADTGISKWTLTGTTRDGARKEVHGCDFYTFRNGQVIRKDSYWKIVE